MGLFQKIGARAKKRANATKRKVGADWEIETKNNFQI